jgi:hypothetical protein
VTLAPSRGHDNDTVVRRGGEEEEGLFKAKAGGGMFIQSKSDEEAELVSSVFGQ